jgi:TolB-like protein/DNA-binding winged helix-turn-helix (wHTH) protein/Tfp pilus assembly protein PilF
MPGPEATVFEFGPFRLDASQHLLFRNGELISLSPKAAEILVVLVHNHGRLVKKDALMRLVWADCFVEESNLTVHISSLRKTLGEGNGMAYIETVPRRGYRFTASVMELCDQEVERKGPSEDVARKRRSRFITVVAILMCGIAAGVFGWEIVKKVFLTPIGASRHIHSVAVLPLKNLTGDPSQEYLADGLTEELVTDLAQIRGLRVISRTSVMTYKDTQKRLPQIARELGVDAVVEGSVARSGEYVRVTAQLIEAATDTHLWAREYDGTMSDLLGMQSQVAQEITEQVGVKLTAQEQLRLQETHLANPESFESYLLGRYYWNKRTEEGFAKAVEYFQKAINEDPRNSRAYAGLADTYVLLAEYTLAPAKDTMPKAEIEAEKALELDESLAEAHTSLAAVKVDFEWDWRGAERELRRAMDLNPNYATAHQWYAELLSQEGRHTEALAEIQRAIELDPLSLIVNAISGRVFLYAGMNERAIEQLRKTLEIDPNFGVATYDLGRAYLKAGDLSNALAEFQKAVVLIPEPDEMGALGYTYVRIGRHAEAHRLLQDCLRQSRSGYVSWYGVTFLYEALGKKDQAFASLGRAYELHDVRLRDVKQEPLLESLRSDVRFSELVHRIGL